MLPNLGQIQFSELFPSLPVAPLPRTGTHSWLQVAGTHRHQERRGNGKSLKLLYQL